MKMLKEEGSALAASRFNKIELSELRSSVGGVFEDMSRGGNEI